MLVRQLPADAIQMTKPHVTNPKPNSERTTAGNIEVGRVASLHLHSKEPGERFQAVEKIEVIEGKGIVGNPRYFARRSRSGGLSKRQVTLIEREQIAEHAATLGMETLRPGDVRSNIETEGIHLTALVGKQVSVAEAVLLFYEPRTPCQKMDALCNGLKTLMEDGKQGVVAQVVRSGTIRVGDPIVAVES
jgi:MOSC domain-containing protein YiiM